MKRVLYTDWDNFFQLHHGSFKAVSVDDTDELTKRFSDSISVELWKKCEDIPVKSFGWPKLNMYYLQKKKTDKLVYAFPVTYIVGRIIFSLLLIPMIFIEQSLLYSLMCIGLISLTFIYSRKIIIFRNSIIYKKRLFLSTKEKRIDISNTTKVLFKGIKFESFSGKSETGYFVYLEKDDKKIVVFGDTGVNMKSIIKIANRIGSFLKLPVEDGRNQVQAL